MKDIKGDPERSQALPCVPPWILRPPVKVDDVGDLVPLAHGGMFG